METYIHRALAVPLFHGASGSSPSISQQRWLLKRAAVVLNAGSLHPVTSIRDSVRSLMVGFALR